MTELKVAVRTKMTLAEALALYPQLNNEPVQMTHYPQGEYYPRWAEFQLVGDGNYRSRIVSRFDSPGREKGE